MTSPAGSRRFAMPGAILLYLIVYLFTSGATSADTVVYTDDILRFFEGRTRGAWELWEFGHLLWRPLGLGLWRMFHPLLAGWSGGSSILEITAVLFAVNFITGVALIPLSFHLCRRLGLACGPAWAVTAGLLLSATVLNYIHSGMSYNTGLAFVLAGQLLLLESRAVWSGIALALAAALWFPYILSLPAAFVIGWVYTGSKTGGDRRRLISVSIASTAVAGIVLFGVGAWLGDIHSPADWMRWIAGSAHGIHQNRQLVRLPTGVTRSFFYFGDNGLLLKRFVFGDPYAPVRWYNLLTAGLWKVAVVFAALAALIWALARRRDWGTLWVVAAGFVPTLLFALFLFETSEPARYETLYPALLAAICTLFRLRPPDKIARGLFIFFLIAMTIVNLRAFGWDVKDVAARASARVRLVQPHIQHHGIAFLVSYRDPVSGYFQHDPFAAEYRQGALPLFHVIEPGALRVATWRKDAACRVLQAWKEGGEVWLSKRLLAARPLPEWNWAEHDDNRVHWTDLPAFFTRFETDADIGDTDGFARVAENAKNRSLAENACEASN